MITKRVANAYLFPNGNLATFGSDGQQIPELQGQYSIETHKRILLESLDDGMFRGFEILPIEFNQVAKDYADYFRGQNLSWEEIQNL